MSKIITHKKFAVKVHDLGFYELSVFNNEEIQITDISQILAAMKELSGEKMPVLVICPEFATTNSEVMKYLSKNENFPYSKAGAYVVFSLAQRLLANFYLKITTPERPTKFFNNKEEAINWLKEFI